VGLELKVLGVVVAVIAAIAVGLVMIGIGEVDTATVESQMPESAKDLPLNPINEIASSDIITFLVDPIPQRQPYPDEIRNGVDIAFNEWDQNNPNLVFEETTNKDADINISWDHIIYGEHRGAGKLDCLAQGEECRIIIALGELNCKKEYAQYDQGKVANILEHEIGHALGLLHISDIDHLMYGIDDSVQENFDTLGLGIPALQEENFVGREPLETQFDSLSQQHEELNSEYEKLYSEYEMFLKDYGFTPETVANSEDTDESEILTLTVKESVEKINAKGNEKNSIAEEINLLTDELNCYPDVENKIVE